jgi:hypothetical protein
MGYITDSQLLNKADLPVSSPVIDIKAGEWVVLTVIKLVPPMSLTYRFCQIEVYSVDWDSGSTPSYVDGSGRGWAYVGLFKNYAGSVSSSTNLIDTTKVVPTGSSDPFDLPAIGSRTVTSVVSAGQYAISNVSGSTLTASATDISGSYPVTTDVYVNGVPGIASQAYSATFASATTFDIAPVTGPGTFDPANPAGNVNTANTYSFILVNNLSNATLRLSVTGQVRLNLS